MRKRSRRETTITIAVDTSCNFNYKDEQGHPAWSHKVKRPAPGEDLRISWKAAENQAQFGVVFVADSPCEGTSFASVNGKATAKVQSNPASAIYKYSVVYFDGRKVCIDDPQIIIS